MHRHYLALILVGLNTGWHYYADPDSGTIDTFIEERCE
jgi:hypothetical protein